MKFFFEVLGIVVILFVIGVFGVVDSTPKKQYNILKNYKGAIVIEKRSNWLYENYTKVYYKDSVVSFCLYDIEYDKINVGDTL
ncbi:MAG: hypothetical protein PHC93_04615 [Candidatus Omnitrophica bacterium]|nr:hypothetical protein [Candidatus Omnitrophota bacterium]